MMEYFLCHSPQIPDVAKRVATKTKWALLIATSVPFLTKLLLKAEWPSLDPNHILYKDIEKDFLEGVSQGYFSDIPPSVGVNIIIGCLRGGCKDLLEKRQPEDYVNKVVCQVLIGLGVDEERALRRACALRCRTAPRCASWQRDCPSFLQQVVLRDPGTGHQV